MSNVRAPAVYPVLESSPIDESRFLPTESNGNGVISSSTQQPLVVPKAPAKSAADARCDRIEREFRKNALRPAPYTGPIAPGRPKGYTPGSGAAIGVRVGGAKDPMHMRMSGRPTATPAFR